MRKQLGTLLVVLATIPLIVGAGGMGSPPPPGGHAPKLVGPTVTATITLDPHTVGITTTAGQGQITLRKGTQISSSFFQVPLTFFLNYGCDVNLTELRFVYDPPARPVRLNNWIPQGVVEAVFAALGYTVDATNTLPVATSVANVACTPDPANPGVVDGTGGNFYGNLTCPDNTTCTNPNNQNIFTDGGGGHAALAGILSFDAVIQFEVFPHDSKKP